MKKNILYTCLLIFFLAAVPLVAEDAGSSSSRKREPWYYSMSFGINSYLARDFRPVAEAHFGVNLDLFRYYVPISDYLLLGGGIQVSGIGDWDDTSAGITIYSAFPSISCQYYFRSIGDGFFLRSDIGVTRSTHDNPDITEKKGVFGFGMLVAAGYAVVLSGGESSLQLYFSYQAHFFEDVSYSFGGFSVGFLW